MHASIHSGAAPDEQSSRRNTELVHRLPNGSAKAPVESPPVQKAAKPYDRNLLQSKQESFRIRQTQPPLSVTIPSNSAAANTRNSPPHPQQVQHNSSLAGNVSSSLLNTPEEYSSIFNAYSSPPIKVRHSGKLDKKLKQIMVLQHSQIDPVAHQHPITGATDSQAHVGAPKSFLEHHVGSSVAHVPGSCGPLAAMQAQPGQKGGQPLPAGVSSFSPNPTREMSATMLHLNSSATSAHQLDNVVLNPERVAAKVYP